MEGKLSEDYSVSEYSYFGVCQLCVCVAVFVYLLQRVAQGLAQQLQNKLTLTRSLTNSIPNLECFSVIVSTE